MSRARVALGYLVGAMLVASAAAHSLLGWPQLAAQLARTNAPADLVVGLALGWHFAGAAMLTLGGIVFWLFRGVARGRALSTAPALWIAAVYLAFGAWAYVVSERNAFFLLTFVMPGLLLLLAAAWPRDAARPNAVGSG